jgi:hypothetical protein
MNGCSGVLSDERCRQLITSKMAADPLRGFHLIDVLHQRLDVTTPAGTCPPWPSRESAADEHHVRSWGEGLAFTELGNDRADESQGGGRAESPGRPP